MVPLCSRHLAMVLDYSSISKVLCSLKPGRMGVTQVNADHGPAAQSKCAVTERFNYPPAIGACVISGRGTLKLKDEPMR
jgi:hypothetical protein